MSKTNRTPATESDIEPANLMYTNGIGQTVGLPDAAALQAEIERLRGREASLAADLDSARNEIFGYELAAETAARAAAGPPRNWLVTLQSALPWVVTATDKANAWTEYQLTTGLTTTLYTPEILPTELPVGRAKV